MGLKKSLQAQLQASRHYSEGLLKDFQTPEQWLHQVHPKANHPLWFAGHMAVTDNFFLSAIAPEKSSLPAGFVEKFGPGSQPTTNPADYPSPEEVVRVMRERREVLASLLAGLSEEDLERPTPAGTPDFLRDWGSVFRVAAWHEAIHSGQLAVCHRALGNSPIITGPPRGKKPAN